jgi:hypothetical protein
MRQIGIVGAKVPIVRRALPLSQRRVPQRDIPRKLTKFRRVEAVRRTDLRVIAYGNGGFGLVQVVLAAKKLGVSAAVITAASSACWNCETLCT